MGKSFELGLDILSCLDLGNIQGFNGLHFAVSLLESFDPAVVNLALDYPSYDTR